MGWTHPRFSGKGVGEGWPQLLPSSPRGPLNTPRLWAEQGLWGDDRGRRSEQAPQPPSPSPSLPPEICFTAPADPILNSTSVFSAEGEAKTWCWEDPSPLLLGPIHSVGPWGALPSEKRHVAPVLPPEVALLNRVAEACRSADRRRWAAGSFCCHIHRSELTEAGALHQLG